MFIINQNDEKVDYNITGLDLPESSLPIGMSGALLTGECTQLDMVGEPGMLMATVSGSATSVAASPSGSYAVDSAGVVASTEITLPAIIATMIGLRAIQNGNSQMPVFALRPRCVELWKKLRRPMGRDNRARSFLLPASREP